MRLKLLLAATLCSLLAVAQRQVNDLKTWEFSHDGRSWEQVTVPHDWAISGPFDKKWDLQRVAIEQNGETEATEKSGRSGALPWIGEGHYRTTIELPTAVGYAELLFDGAMAEPVVKVNGVVAGEWKYGYNAFRVDITPYVKEGANLVEVDLRNLEESSRWYPGAGLYRPVTLIVYNVNENANVPRIDDWGIRYETTKIHDGRNDVAWMKVEVPVANHLPDAAVGLELMDANGKVLSQISPADTPMHDNRAGTTFGVAHAKLWSPEHPYLYRLKASLWYKGKILDEKTINVGLRTVSVSKERGFELNGVSRKIKGVCLHHDLGPLGAAIDKAALIRQIRILKDMGCDAIRTAHNMPSTMQMEICDSMGMMVMAESFDMWIYPKCKNGYARFFKEWADKDITNLVLNHRNHPSIVMWSIGNEIPEQWDANEGVAWARHLQDLVHQLDPTRPVTQGMDRADDALKSGFAQVMDVPGFNYRVHKYDNNITQLPKGFLLGSETASTVSSRGVYKFPVKLSDNSQYASYSPNYDPTALTTADGQCSSYDVEWCPWSNLPDDDFLMMDDRPWTIGQFVWTGFDYLGEPTPYDEYWPSRSSYFGICDLAGLPKDRYWLYRSQWNKQDHTLHMLPHWTWPGREGQVTPVFVYTDYPEAELFVNGKSQGRLRKNINAKDILCNPDASSDADSRIALLDRYRLRWNDVVYEPGEIRVVAYDKDGKKADEQTIRTAGKPAKFRFEVEPIEGDLVFIDVSMVDENGNFVPTADDQLEFDVTGNGEFKAVCNGDATSLESFTQPRMRLFSGRVVLIVRRGAGSEPFTINVRTVDGTLSGSVNVRVE